jgi:hypothetical protein
VFSQRTSSILIDSWTIESRLTLPQTRSSSFLLTLVLVSALGNRLASHLLSQRVPSLTTCPLALFPRPKQFAYHETSFFLIRLLQQFTNLKHVPEAQPPSSLPPPEWKLASGTKGTDDFRIKSYLTMSAMVSESTTFDGLYLLLYAFRAGVGCLWKRVRPSRVVSRP